MNRLTNEQALEILKGDFSKVPLKENETHSGLFSEAFNMAIEALETMCKRCTNYEMCMGTGCEPKKTLKRMVENSEVKE